MLGNCQCVISGGAIEIEPYIPPLYAFGTFWESTHRVFMSATVIDDAFLVKGLQLSHNTISKPLTYEKERWSGEKMVLIPSLIHESLSRTEIVSLFAKPNSGRKYGVVALVPSFYKTKDWEAYGATVAKRETVGTVIAGLQRGTFDKTVVLVNRYDGIDLPDEACRILIFDGKPYSESLIDLYQETCRPDSEATQRRTVRTVEQGLGRSVRGEKDYSVIVIAGTDLTRLVREKGSRKFLSNQMATQIDIGIGITEMAHQEIVSGDKPMVAFINLIQQCLKRDSGWKAFYTEQMEVVRPSGPNMQVLQMYATELEAEQKYNQGDYAGASLALQEALRWWHHRSRRSGLVPARDGPI